MTVNGRSGVYLVNAALLVEMDYRNGNVNAIRRPQLAKALNVWGSHHKQGNVKSSHVLVIFFHELSIQLIVIAVKILYMHIMVYVYI